MKVNNSTKPSAKISLKNESQQFHKAQLEKKFKIWESTIPQSPARKKCDKQMILYIIKYDAPLWNVKTMVILM
jgi:hypothetical protein